MPLLSIRTRYALHAAAYVAGHANRGPVSRDRIVAYLEAYSGGLRLSHGYLTKLLADLSRAEILRPAFGPGGGYVLARPADIIPVVAVIEALEGPIRSDCCLLSVGECRSQGRCGVQGVIGRAEHVFYDVFQRETLGSLASRMHFDEARAPLG